MAVDRAGEKLGTVVALHNFGAGDLIEVRQTDGHVTQLLPFDEATVPVVDLAAGRLVVVAPDMDQQAPPAARGNRRR